MASTWINWVGLLIACLAALLWGVSSGQPDVLSIVMSVISVGVVGYAIADNWSLTSSGNNANSIASANSRHMGFVWALGALGLLFSYTLFIEWKEWLVFTGVFGLVALLVVGFAFIVGNGNDTLASSETDKGEDALLKLARYLTIAQLVGMVATMIGLAVDGKIPASVQPNSAWHDWAANVIFFYGALMLAAISANALYTSAKK